MNIPLSVESIEKDRKEHLSIWVDKENKVIPSPINPYFYSTKKLSIPAKITAIKARRLSDYKEVTFYKYEFNTRKELVKYRNDDTYEDNIPFVLRNRIDDPKIYTKYPHAKLLKFNFIDIEQDCPEGKLFPTYEDIITSLSFKINGSKIRTIHLKRDTQSDSKLLQMYQDKYPFPDVEVMYNKGYDLPMILERCKRNGMKTNWFSKDFSDPYVGGKHGIRINGMVIYDVLDSTRKDQSLTGNVPNKGLKTVSDYFGFKSTAKVLKGDEISAAKGTKELIEYNREDVERLKFLFDIYWGNIEYTAEDLKIPLNLAVDLNITDLGIIVLGDLYREHNIIADGDNYSRYPEIFQRKKEQGSSNYQGALVYIKRRGLFTPLLKADYSSMYPTIVAEFNLSPDTCRLVRYDKYKKGGFKIEEDDKTFTYHIPDISLKKTVVIQTRKDKEGFLAQAVHRFLDERAKYKKEWKKTGSKIARARSDTAKVKANGGVYGNMGNPHHPFGFAPIAVATTGIGRECAKLLINILEELYPESVIEVDTDGVYFSAEDWNEERIQYYFNKALEKKFKKKLNLTIDIDEYKRGFFHKAKNYVLLTKEGNIILHGAAFKASSKDPLSKKLVSDIAKAKLEGKSTDGIVMKYKNQMLDFPLRDFAMQVTMGKNLNEYKSLNCLSVKIATQALQHFDIKPQAGNSYHYIKCIGGYKLFQLASKAEIDKKYYRKKIERTIKMLDAGFSNHKKIGDFLDDEGGSWEEATKDIKKEKPKSIDDFL